MRSGWASWSRSWDAVGDDATESRDGPRAAFADCRRLCITVTNSEHNKTPFTQVVSASRMLVDAGEDRSLVRSQLRDFN